MNKYFSIITALTICALTVGCSSKKTGQASSEKIPAEVKVITPDSIVFDWQDAYQEKLESFSANPDSRFDLCDLNNDGSPELIISPDSVATTKCEVYTYSDGALREFTQIGSEGQFWFIPSKSVIGYEYDGSGFVIGEYYSVSGNNLESALSYYNNAASASSGAAISYEVNSTDVAYGTYMEMLSEFTNPVTLSVGRKYSFGQESLNYALHYSESWGAVLSDAQKTAFRTKLLELAEEFPEPEMSKGYSPAFDICDLNGDDIPELILSVGTNPDDFCRIFVLQDDELAELSDPCGAGGEIKFDVSQKVYFSTNISGETVYQSFVNENLNDFKPSDNIIVCGRRYPVTDSGILAASL